MPTTGRCRRNEPVEPWNCADPNVKIPPSEPTSQYPWDGGGGGGGGGGGLLTASVVVPVEPENTVSPE
jgi:hypothetical protein